MYKKPKQSKDFIGYYDIPGYNRYAISTNGTIINKATNLKLKGSVNPAGYHNYRLTNDEGNTKTWGRYRLLAYVFKHPEESIDDLVVNHIDGIKSNDSLENLEWTTQQGNIEHAGKFGLTTKCIPISVRDVNTGYITDYPSATACARELGLTKDAILYRIKSGEDRIFPELKQYRITSDKPWVIPQNVKLALLKNGTLKKVILKDIVNDSVTMFDKIADVASFLNVSPTTVNEWLQKTNQPIVLSRYQIKFAWDETPWRIIEDLDREILISNRSRRVVKVVKDDTNVVRIFNSALECAEAMNITPTALNHRLKSNGSKVFKDGYTYCYY